MPNHINLLLETILQEAKAAREDVINLKNNMVTHEVFQKNVESMNDKLNLITEEQKKHKNDLEIMNQKFIKKTFNFSKIYKTICFLLAFGFCGLVFPKMILSHQEIVSEITHYFLSFHGYN